MAFFKESNKNGSNLYSRIRDHESSLKKRLEEYWKKFEPYSDKDFLDGIEENFHQKWWEMYLGIGLLNLKLNLNPSRQVIGPDFEINLTDKNVWIEAVAPKIGTGNNALPKLLEGVHELPEKEFLLRLTNSIDNKVKAFNSYKNKFISANGSFIIAISSCALSEYGSLMDYPVPAPLKVLAGAGNLVVSKEGNYVDSRKKVNTYSGNPVDTNLFEQKKFTSISAVLYSNCNILNCNNKPEETFQIFLNPNVETSYYFEIFQGIDIWYKLPDSDEQIWKKKNA